MRLFGKNPVYERLRSNPQSVRHISIQDDFNEAGYLHQKAKKWGISVFIIPKTKMLKLGQNINTQGIMAEVDNFAYVNINEFLAIAVDKKLTIMFLDNLNDPQNLGAILRTLACLGGFGLVIPTHDSVEVTPSVLRIASGAENYVPIAKVSNLNTAIRSAKQEGFSIVGSLVGKGESLYETEMPLHVGVVVGSEQKGIRPIVEKELDLIVNIPMPIHTLTLNAAHAASILAYEITRQKKQKH